MDNDVWKLPELRAWFQLNAREPTPDMGGSGSATSGYMIPPSPTRARSVVPLRVSTAPVAFVGKRMPTPGFNDFEGCLKQQKHNAELKLKERHYYPPQAPGRVPGFRQAPWLDRPDG